MSSSAIDDLTSLARGFLQDLLRFDTSNPPGREDLLIEYLARFLENTSARVEVIRSPQGRPSLMAYLEGSENLSPLVLSSHVDTVPAGDLGQWTYPPFSGVLADDCFWGRGALDMKFKTAFDLAVFFELSKKSQRARPVVLTALADEESGGHQGVRWVIQSRPEIFRDALVFNELGGFNLEVAGTTFVPIQCGERGRAELEVRIRAKSTHSSVGYPGNPLHLLAQVLLALQEFTWRYTVCDLSKRFFSELARLLPAPLSPLFNGITSAEGAGAVFENIPDLDLAAQLAAMLSHSVTPIRVTGGGAQAVTPEEVVLVCDCRMVPGVSIETFTRLIAERLAHIPGCSVALSNVELGYQCELPGDLPKLLATKTTEVWGPGYHVVPYLLPAGSDNTHFFQAGALPVGFSPLLFPPAFPGISLAHSANERIPLSTFDKGFALYRAVVLSYVESASEAS